MTYRVNTPSVIHEIIDGEAVLVNMETGSYYSIDSVGAVVWAQIEKGLSGSQIVAAISSQYEGDEDAIAAGVDTLLTELLAERLIVAAEAAVDSDQAAAVHHPDPSVAKPAFVPPVLNKYTDMEDLLLLDPIHEVDQTGWPKTNPKDA